MLKNCPTVELPHSRLILWGQYLVQILIEFIFTIALLEKPWLTPLLQCIWVQEYTVSIINFSTFSNLQNSRAKMTVFYEDEATETLPMSPAMRYTRNIVDLQELHTENKIETFKGKFTPLHYQSWLFRLGETSKRLYRLLNGASEDFSTFDTKKYESKTSIFDRKYSHAPNIINNSKFCVDWGCWALMYSRQ